MRIQIGMHVKIVDNEASYGDYAGKDKKITKHLRHFEYRGKKHRAYELDDQEQEIWVEEDFQYIVEYPHLPID